ncbi:MAG: cyclic-phosphate processing receiver domain-containing protein [Polyangiales bacterium]
MAYALFLDDERVPSPRFDPLAATPGEAQYAALPASLGSRTDFVIARSSAEAIAVVSSRGLPALLCLDHDLGGDDTVMAFLRWWTERVDAPFPELYVHSENPVGRRNVESFVRSWNRAREE